MILESALVALHDRFDALEVIDVEGPYDRHVRSLGDRDALVVVRRHSDWPELVPEGVVELLQSSPGSHVVLLSTVDVADVDPSTMATWSRTLARPIERLEPAHANQGSSIVLSPVGEGGQLDGELALSCTVIDALRFRLATATADLAAADREWRALSATLHMVRRQLEGALRIPDSASYRIGHAIVTTVRNPAKTLRRSLRRHDTAAVGRTGTRPHRPARSESPTHPDRELLWAFRPEPRRPTSAVIGRRQLAHDEPNRILLLPHDAAAMLTAVEPERVIIESRAGDPAEPWAGLGGTSRPHLMSALLDVLRICRTSGTPIEARWTCPAADAEWMATVEAWATPVAGDHQPEHDE